MSLHHFEQSEEMDLQFSAGDGITITMRVTVGPHGDGWRWWAGGDNKGPLVLGKHPEEDEASPWPRRDSCACSFGLSKADALGGLRQYLEAHVQLSLRPTIERWTRRDRTAAQ